MDEHKTALIFRPREIEILHFVAECYTNREIADFLGVQDATVRNSISYIMRLLRIRERPHLIRYAQTHGYGAKQSPRITEALTPLSVTTQNSETSM